MGSQAVILGNDGEEDVLEIRTYLLKLREGTMLPIHNDLYALEVRCSLMSFIYEINFPFDFRTDVLNIVYNDN